MHIKRKHAILSASGASRWLACTPSARLEEFEPESRSTYADEGTLAHEYAEVCLTGSPHTLITTPEMKENVQGYVDRCRALDCDFFEVECRVDFSHLVPEGYGTCDFISIKSSTLFIRDLKYGAGVLVRADTSQLKLYALGALRKYRLMYDLTHVNLGIDQPRMVNLDVINITVVELEAWGESIRFKALQAYNGEGEQVPGDHCRFCKVQHKCVKQNEIALSVFGEDQPASIISDDRVLEIYNQRSSIRAYLTEVENYVFAQALNGKKWPGLKLVEGRSVRSIPEGSQKELYDHLRGLGYHKGDIIVQKIKGIGEVEKSLGREAFNREVVPFLRKSEGKPSLVAENDPRKEMEINPLKKFEND